MKPSSTSTLDPKHKEDLTQLVLDATRKAIGVTIDELTDAGVLNNSNIQRVRMQGDRIVANVTARVKETLAELAENIVDRLKLISGAKTIILKPTSGEKVIGRAKTTFRSYIDSDFTGWDLNVKGKPTSETPVHIYELVRDGTFAQIYGGLNENLDALCLSQEQIIDFCENHSEWLSANFWTFFLFKVGEELFFARVSVDSGGLSVDVRRFSSDHVWHAESRYRFVLPQLTTLKT